MTDPEFISNCPVVSQEDHFMTNNLDSASPAVTPQCDVTSYDFSQHFPLGNQMTFQASSAGYGPLEGWITSGKPSLARFAHDATSELQFHPASDADAHNRGHLPSVATLATASPSTRAFSEKQGAASRPTRRWSQQGPKSEMLTMSPSIKGRNMKLRSASRASKNADHNPPATAEERRSRGYHNEVEEQYRNRLNEQFESLLNALLEDIRRGSGGNNGGYSYKGLDSPGHKVGRAEVLDMARRHIKLLEQECAIVRGERGELRNNARTLRWTYDQCESGDISDLKAVPSRTQTDGM